MNIDNLHKLIVIRNQIAMIVSSPNIVNREDYKKLDKLRSYMDKLFVEQCVNLSNLPDHRVEKFLGLYNENIGTFKVSEKVGDLQEKKKASINDNVSNVSGNKNAKISAKIADLEKNKKSAKKSTAKISKVSKNAKVSAKVGNLQKKKDKLIDELLAEDVKFS